MNSKIKYILLLAFLPAIYSCIPRKCCPDQFKWTRGKLNREENESKIILSELVLSEGSKVFTLGGTNQGAFETYDLQTKKWTLFPSIPIPVAFPGGVILNHSIYLLGGMDTLSVYSTAFQKFDLIQNRWFQLPALTTRRSYTASAVCEGKLYLIGGKTGQDDPHAQILSLVEEYDPVSETWIKKPDMPTSRYSPSVVVIADKIIVAGGYTNDGETGIVEEYAPLTNTWTRKADMPSPNGSFGLINMENSIYAIGGRPYQNLSPILKYDLNADQWTQVGTLPELRNWFGITVIGKHVYIIGDEKNPRSILIGKKE